MVNKKYEIFDNQWLEMIDLPAIIIDSYGKIVWYNHAAVNSFNYNGEDCNFLTRENDSDNNISHCSNDVINGCLLRKFIDDFILEPGFKKRIYKNMGEFWELTLKHLKNDMVLVYGIEYTNQKAAEMLLDKHFKGIDTTIEQDRDAFESIIQGLGFNNVFREIVELIFLPVLVFQENDLVFANKSYIDFAGGKIKLLTRDIQVKLTELDNGVKSNTGEKMIVEFKNNNEYLNIECMFYKLSDDNDQKMHAVVLMPGTDLLVKEKLGKTQKRHSDEEKMELNILFVEDKIINQKVLSLMLENMGCKVDLANNGKEGVDMAAKKHYDLIFMDLQMPLMNGLTAANIISKKQKNAPSIIAVTAYYDIVDEKELAENGIVDVISKPFSSKDIFEKLIYWAQQK